MKITLNGTRSQYRSIKRILDAAGFEDNGGIKFDKYHLGTFEGGPNGILFTTEPHKKKYRLHSSYTKINFDLSKEYQQAVDAILDPKEVPHVGDYEVSKVKGSLNTYKVGCRELSDQFLRTAQDLIKNHNIVVSLGGKPITDDLINLNLDLCQVE